MGLIIIFTSSCNKNNDTNNPSTNGDVPKLTSAEISDVKQTTALCVANIYEQGSTAIKACGVCWSTNQTPTINDNKTNLNSQIGSFNTVISGLECNTTYYVRSYATNSAGTGYGSAVSLTTLDGIGTVKDIDGNLYNTVVIGTQTWMVEDLSTTRFNDGTAIPKVTDNAEYTDDAEWAALTTPAYTGEPDVLNRVHALYNWYAVNTGKLCPVGWHVPSDNDFLTLMNYLTANGYSYDGTTTVDEYGINKIAKSLANCAMWYNLYPYEVGSIAYPGFTEKDNSSGFTALPNGFRSATGFTGYGGKEGYWWSSSNYVSNIATGITMSYMRPNVSYTQTDKKCGYSVRCVKNN